MRQIPNIATLLAILQLGSFLPSQRTLAASEPAPNEPVENFQLQDYRGNKVELSDFGDKSAVVVAFLGAECPLAKHYGARLVKLEQEYGSKGVAFVGVNSNRQDSLAEIAAYARQHQIEFPIVKDLSNRLADKLGAKRTPQVFVLDRKRAVCYSGRIDDQFGIGYSRDKPTSQELRDALDAVLSDRPVAVKSTEPVGCLIGRVKNLSERSGPVKPNATFSYTQHIAPIFQKSCVECHRAGEIGPFALTEYDEIVGWSDTIGEVIQQERMPPWHASPDFGKFENERRLSAEEKNMILKWIVDGSPRGSDELPPDKVEFSAGWHLPKEPDLIIPIGKEPVRIEAANSMRYQYIRVPTGFTEDRWFSAAQLLPGNRSVVHHILVFAIPPKPLRSRLDDLEGGRRGFLAGYVPGHRSRPYPAGMAKKIPAGSELVFQIHYTPNGSQQTDHSKLGLVFVDPGSVTHEVRTTSSATRSLRIPPRVEHHRVEATTTIRGGDVQLLGMMPHMHVRGKSFFYEAIYADGTKETLLDVPRFDFNWQTAYRLAEPKSLAAGTQIHCVAHFDNSENNLNNPDPSRTVRWGEQTWDEMMIGYFDIAIPLGKDVTNEESDVARDTPPNEIVRRLDTNGDGVIQKTEVPARLHPYFDQLDTNGDANLDGSELQLLARLRLFRS